MPYDHPSGVYGQRQVGDFAFVRKYAGFTANALEDPYQPALPPFVYGVQGGGAALGARLRRAEGECAEGFC
jgi:hypothetical protein